MKYNKLLLLLTTLLLSLSFISAANTLTFNTPVTGGDVSTDTQVVNASLDTNTLSIMNVSYWYAIATAPTTWIFIKNVSLIGNKTDNFNITWDASSATLGVDDNYYVLNATAWNTTDYVTGDNISINLNNGNPTATLSSSTIHNNYIAGKDDPFVIGLAADSTIGISFCNASFINTRNSSIVKITELTVSSNACSNTTVRANGLLAEGESYLMSVEATDGNNDKINSSTRLLKVTTSAGAPAQVGEQPVTTINIQDKILIFTDKIANIPSFIKGLVTKFINLFR